MYIATSLALLLNAILSVHGATTSVFGNSKDMTFLQVRATKDALTSMSVPVTGLPSINGLQAPRDRQLVIGDEFHVPQGTTFSKALCAPKYMLALKKSTGELFLAGKPVGVTNIKLYEGFHYPYLTTQDVTGLRFKLVDRVVNFAGKSLKVGTPQLQVISEGKQKGKCVGRFQMVYTLVDCDDPAGTRVSLHEPDFSQC